MPDVINYGLKWLSRNTFWQNLIHFLYNLQCKIHILSHTLKEDECIIEIPAAFQKCNLEIMMPLKNNIIIVFRFYNFFCLQL